MHAHAGGGLGRVEQGRYPRTLATPSAAGAVPHDRIFSIYYSIYCSRCCWPGVGRGLWSGEGRERPVGCRTALGVLEWGSEPAPWGQLVPVATCAVGSLQREGALLQRRAC